MAKKKTYYIPTIEIISLQTTEMMQWALGGSPSHNVPNGGSGAPKRFTPAF